MTMSERVKIPVVSAWAKQLKAVEMYYYGGVVDNLDSLLDAILFSVLKYQQHGYAEKRIDINDTLQV